MKEIQDIVQAYALLHQEQKKAALATVVHVEGSSYRRPGARMLVSEDGQLTGAISGGCLEGDALRKARLAMSQGKPALVKYDTIDDDDASLGVGLGCNGIIHILIEPIHPAEPNHPLILLEQVVKQREAAVQVTLFSLQDRKADQPGSCLLLQGDTWRHRNNLPTELLSGLHQKAQQARHQNTSSIETITFAEQTYTAFIEVIQPAPALVICGAGNDVMPLVNMAALLGWFTTVIDGRGNYATAERFPNADQVLVSRPEQVLSHVNVDARTVFLLLTHNYNYDLAMLRQLMPLPIPYVGVLGPKKKLDRLLQELQEEGTPLTQAQLSKVYGPAGLDLGAETSEEIALSILAEIKAVLSQRNGGSLRTKTQPIHVNTGSTQLDHSFFS
jgi:xanthine dehydrogenase accessory factor